MTSVLPVLETASSEPPASSEKTGLTRWSDWLGVVAAIGCAIHCAAMPLIIAYLPALGLSFLADEGFHQAVEDFVSAERDELDFQIKHLSRHAPFKKQP